MIRILHVLQGMNIGGQESFLMNVYGSIDRSKVQFDFLINNTGHNDYEEQIIAMGGRVYKTCTKGSGYLNFLKKTKSVFKTMDYDYQVAHFHSGSLYSIYGWSFTKVFRIKHKIIHSHSTHYFNDLVGLKRGFIQWITPKVFSKMFACSNEAGMWLYGEKTMNNNQVEVIPNGIDIQAFAYNASEGHKIRKSLAISQDHKVIGLIGRLVEAKNHLFLIDVFKELVEMDQNYKLVLVGDGDLRGSIEEAISSYGLGDDVFMLGSRNDVAAIYSALDGFVMPSIYEGLPLAAVEAQASGLPVFASRAVTGEIDLTNLVLHMALKDGPKKWAQTIHGLMTERLRSEGYVSKGIDSFDISHTASKLTQLYIELGTI